VSYTKGSELSLDMWTALYQHIVSVAGIGGRVTSGVSKLRRPEVFQGTTVNVIEVRRGTVLGYLTDGNYTGEQTFLDESDAVRCLLHPRTHCKIGALRIAQASDVNRYCSNVCRYPTNITAMENTELLYLTKNSQHITHYPECHQKLGHSIASPISCGQNISHLWYNALTFCSLSGLREVKRAFPEVQSSIQNELHSREQDERQRRLFSDAARGDDTLSIPELHKLLKEKLYFTDDAIAKLTIDHSGDKFVDEYLLRV
jgi:hypothetical protein